MCQKEVQNKEMGVVGFARSRGGLILMIALLLGGIIFHAIAASLK